jgi:hypothetical protein
MPHIWSSYYLVRYRDDYKMLKISCTSALNHFNETEKLSEDVSPAVERRLVLAAQVELLACHEHDLLRTTLFANGVGHLNLKIIDLEALADQNVSLYDTVSAYR